MSNTRLPLSIARLSLFSTRPSNTQGGDGLAYCQGRRRVRQRPTAPPWPFIRVVTRRNSLCKLRCTRNGVVGLNCTSPVPNRRGSGGIRAHPATVTAPGTQYSAKIISPSDLSRRLDMSSGSGISLHLITSGKAWSKFNGCEIR